MPKTANKQVEIFKTNVERESQAAQLNEVLTLHFPGNKINFDLEDCDKILRIEGSFIDTDHVLHIVQNQGFICDIIQ